MGFGKLTKSVFSEVNTLKTQNDGAKYISSIIRNYNMDRTLRAH